MNWFFGLDIIAREPNPVQTYLDLFHCGGRGEEAAEALLEQNLKRAWKTRDLL